MAAEGSGITSLYASWADYQAREKAADSLEGQVTAMLTAMSRSLDRKLGAIPGGFTSLDAQTFVFQSYGGSRLWLRDSAAYVYPPADRRRRRHQGRLRRDRRVRRFRLAVDFDDVFVWPIPLNHAAHGEPARAGTPPARRVAADRLAVRRRVGPDHRRLGLGGHPPPRSWS